jgi:hypothetical protein
MLVTEFFRLILTEEFLVADQYDSQCCVDYVARYSSKRGNETKENRRFKYEMYCISTRNKFESKTGKNNKYL